MLKSRIGTLSILFALAVNAATAPQANLFGAIRANDLMSVRAAVASRVDMEAPGPGGATPLLHAAAVGSTEAMRILIEGGADVNGRSAPAATPLIWASGDVAKVRLLAEAGTDVKASSKNGKTALHTAAGRAGASAAVRVLLDSGAEPDAADSLGGTPLLAAAVADDMRSVGMLLEAGADAARGDMAGYTPLHYAAGHGNLAMVKVLLAQGVAVDARTVFGGAVKHGDLALKQLTPLMLAAPKADAAVLQALLDVGADVNAQDVRGMTPLMLAIASDHRHPRAVKTLLAAGADAQMADQNGDTAMDWAARYHDRDVMAELTRAGAKPGSRKPDAPRTGRTSDRTTRESAEAGMAMVQRGTAEFFRQSGCVGCHHQNMAQIAVAAAKSTDVRYDPVAARETVQAVAAQWNIFAGGLLERMDAPGSPDTPTFSLFGLALSDYPADTATDALFANIASQQLTDGSWDMPGFARAPLEESRFQRTAMAVRALNHYAPAGRGAEMRQIQDRARAWLTAAKPSTSGDHAWRLLGLYWTGADAKERAQAVRKLLSLQRPDGGWGPTEHMPSDTFSTGEALWALYTAEAAGPGSAKYAQGAAYLLHTQQADGSWFQAARAPKFQPYFESGFPYGHNQWLSMAATAWASAALAPMD